LASTYEGKISVTFLREDISYERISLKAYGLLGLKTSLLLKYHSPKCHQGIEISTIESCSGCVVDDVGGSMLIGTNLDVTTVFFLKNLHS